ncbi:MAG: hypothetical protein SV062_08060 [Thermodesulfobacteriota bacterium]|nr:hypothetical protein [Thermodesulfobacteriota bacterium]
MGNGYRYCKVGATALSAGQLMQGPAPDALCTNKAIAATASVGAKTVFVGMGAVSAAVDILRDGILIINDAAGEGYHYKIESNKAAAASSTAELTLRDELMVALTTLSEANAVPSQYNGIVVSTDSAILTGPVVGVTIVSAAASGYCWIQSKGLAPCLAEGSWVVGNRLTKGSAAGSLRPVTTGDTTFESYYGEVIRTVAATEYGLVKLCID